MFFFLEPLPRFWEVVGVLSITSDPFLTLNNPLLSWALASRNTGSRKDQAFDPAWKGWILQTALQGTSYDVVPLVPLLSVLFTRIKIYLSLFPFSLQRKMLLFRDWKAALFAYPFFYSTEIHSCSSLEASVFPTACLKLAPASPKYLSLKYTPGTIQLHQGPVYLLQSEASTCS